MIKYEDRITIDKDEICVCGHGWWNHIINPFRGHRHYLECETCMCPKFMYAHTRIQHRTGSFCGDIIKEENVIE